MVKVRVESQRCHIFKSFEVSYIRVFLHWSKTPHMKLKFDPGKKILARSFSEYRILTKKKSSVPSPIWMHPTKHAPGISIMLICLAK
jgi:hypothetical protein